MKLKKPSICLRIILFAFLIQCSAATVYSQRFATAAVAGFNASQVDGDMLAGFDKVGFTGGVRAIVDFESAFDLNVEFLYSERGSRPDIFNPEYDPDINFNLSYIELPVYMSLGDWWQEEGEYYKVSVQAGLSYARLIKASVEDFYHSDEESYELLVPYFTDNDLSWMVGATYKMSSRWAVTGRYTRGIIPLFDPEKHNIAAEKLTSYFLTFRAEYYF